MAEQTTIAALATPTGKGGIGIIRISGNRSMEIAGKCFYLSGDTKLERYDSHRVYYGFVRDEKGRVLDEVLFIPMKAPRSYTTEDVVEIQSHSSPVVLRSILSLLVRYGAVLAEPGEFTKRAYMNGRIDLTQAEAVIDIINARTEASVNIAVSQIEGSLKKQIMLMKDEILELHAKIEAVIDFPEDVGDILDQDQVFKSFVRIQSELSELKKNHEDLHVFREGVRLVIVGPPNSGKSSLLNALVNKDKAIVTPVPGTTRDAIEDLITIDGIPIEITDTAGVHQTDDVVEKIGIQRTLDKMDSADLVILMIDASQMLCDSECESINTIYGKCKGRKKMLVVANKIDLDYHCIKDERIPEPDIRISVLKRENMEYLKSRISEMILRDIPENRCAVVPNLRHYNLICETLGSIDRIIRGMEDGVTFDLLAVDIRSCIRSLDAILGIHVQDDVLDRIFSNFCIGK